MEFMHASRGQDTFAPMPKPKCALIEIYHSHDVNLYSQILFLKGLGYDVTLIVGKGLRSQVWNIREEAEIHFVDINDKTGLRLWRALWDLRRLLIKGRFTKVIFNTAHSNPVRNFCLLPFPKWMRFYGTLHGVNKLIGSGTQRIISRRIPNYYVLMDYMLQKAEQVSGNKLRLGVYYPIFHPEYADVLLPQKEAGMLWVAIPGAVEYKRRDYLTLLDALSKLPSKVPIHFFLLGNGQHAHGSGNNLKMRINKLGLQDYFTFFNSFVPNEVLHSYVRNCDAVMPLIHPINRDMEKYLENQISGSFHLAFAYRKPLLMHDYYERYEDFRETSLFYSLESLPHFLADLPAALGRLGDLYASPKWTLDFQTKSYGALLEK